MHSFPVIRFLVSKLVSENIGSDWRNLARQFNFMTENEIEDIGCNENFSSDAQRSSQVRSGTMNNSD